MTQMNNFDYSKTGLPENKRFHMAGNICHQWLTRHMGRMFKPDQILNFMDNQPVNAAKTLLEKTDNPSEESVTVALLGPAKGNMIAQDNSPEQKSMENEARLIFGDRCIDLIRALAGEPTTDPQIIRDTKRIFLVEGISTMQDQLIGRKRIDPHHQVRWDIVKQLEANFAKIKGENPEIDEMFEPMLAESRTTLENLDKAAAAKKQRNHKPK